MNVGAIVVICPILHILEKKKKIFPLVCHFLSPGYLWLSSIYIFYEYHGKEKISVTTILSFCEDDKISGICNSNKFPKVFVYNAGEIKLNYLLSCSLTFYKIKNLTEITRLKQYSSFEKKNFTDSVHECSLYLSRTILASKSQIQLAKCNVVFTTHIWSYLTFQKMNYLSVKQAILCQIQLQV